MTGSVHMAFAGSIVVTDRADLRHPAQNVVILPGGAHTTFAVSIMDAEQAGTHNEPFIFRRATTQQCRGGGTPAWCTPADEGT